MVRCSSPREPAPRAWRPATWPGPRPPTNSARTREGSRSELELPLFESWDASRLKIVLCALMRRSWVTWVVYSRGEERAVMSAREFRPLCEAAGLRCLIVERLSWSLMLEFVFLKLIGQRNLDLKNMIVKWYLEVDRVAVGGTYYSAYCSTLIASGSDLRRRTTLAVACSSRRWFESRQELQIRSQKVKKWPSIKLLLTLSDIKK